MPLRATVFFVAMWIALATAFLSSVIPGGLPRTTSIGSAFHPSTSAVALQPGRAQPRLAVGTERRDDRHGGGQGDVVAPELLTVEPVPSRTTMTHVTLMRSAVANLTPRAALDGSPRGPPLN